jgi:cobalt-zinc-cadmium efflux system outer membrane protein
VLNDVRRAYYRALIAQRRVETTEQLRDLSGELVGRAEALLQGREGSQVNLLQAKTEAEMIRLNQATAENQLLIAWRQLAAVVGAPDLERRPLAGDAMEPVPMITWDDALDTLRTESPEMPVALTNVERARWELNRAMAGRVPDVSGWVAVQHDYATDDTVTSVQVGVPLPFFNRNQGSIAKARAELLDAERALERVELDLMNRLAAVYGRYATAQQQAEVYTRDILPNATQALELVRVGYREGETDYLTVLTAQRTYFQASLAYLDSLQEAKEATVEIEGSLLTGSLETP